MVALVKAQQTFGWTPPQIGPARKVILAFSTICAYSPLSWSALVPIPNQVGTGSGPASADVSSVEVAIRSRNDDVQPPHLVVDNNDFVRNVKHEISLI